MPIESTFLPGIMIVVKGLPYRALAAPVADEAGVPMFAEILLIHRGRLHRMVPVPLLSATLTVRAPLDGDPGDGDDDDGFPTSLPVDVADFRKPLTTE